MIRYVYGFSEEQLSWVDEDPSRQLVFLEEGFPMVVDHPRIHFRCLGARLDEALEECAAEFPHEKIEILGRSSSRFRKIKELLLRKTVLWHSVTSEAITGHLLHKNIIANLRRLPQCAYVNPWKDAFKDQPVIICGAGPSLQKTLLQRDQALIIACGSALSALSHLGVRPHLGIAIDPNEREYDCLKGCTYRDLPLVFGSRLLPKVFDLFDGPYGYIRSGTGGALESYVEEKLGMNETYIGTDLGREALSVTTLAVSLAHFLGCNPILLAGVDLAYEGKKHYSSGVQAEPQIDKVLRRDGVSTNLKWVMERDTLDLYAKNHPQTTFGRLSKAGLPFKHIPFRTLSSERFDFDKKVKGLFQPMKLSQPVDEVLASLKESFQRCLTLLELLQNEKTGKSVLYQLDLEEEIAYQLVLKAAQMSLERIGQGSFSHLRAVCQGYLELF